MAVPVKGVAYNIAFDGLVKMELPPEGDLPRTDTNGHEPKEQK